jgi:flagellar hook assembly protein FlgD
MPNPFNASTSIYFNLDQQSEVKLGIYNVTGRLVREYNLTAGSGHHSIVWDGTDARGNQVASGIYFYRLRAGIVNQTRKMVLLR